MEYLLELAACTKALMTWTHAAHHVTKGASFSGDHVNLFGELYEEVINDFDELIEKSIVILDNETVACPVQLTVNSLKYIQQFDSPVEKHEDEIACIALDFIRHHISHLSFVYDIMDKDGVLSLGMDDYLSSASGKYEKFEYLLGQRIKKGY